MPQIGWWLLPFVVLFGLSPAPCRRIRLRRTPFDGLLLVLGVTAVIALIPAYNRPNAFIKLANIGGGLVLYYVLAGRQRRDAWWLAGLLGVMGGAVALVFLLAHDWQAWPADLAVVTRLGLAWMRLRPSLSLPAIHPNQAGGLVALLLPFALAWAGHGWRQRRWIVVGTAVLLSGIMFLGLLLSSSRGAWLALAAAAMIVLLWLVSRKLGQHTIWPAQRTFLLLLFLFLLIALGLSFVVADGPLSLAGRLPGADSSTTRLDLYRQTSNLIADFPFTGGGLAAFPGLYSQYIAVTPFFVFDYSHNLWLDVAVEQGIAAALALILLYAGCVWRLWYGAAAFRADDYFGWATAVSLLTLLLHSLVDDPLYGGLGTPLLLALPGLVVMLTAQPESEQARRWPTAVSVRLAGLVAVLLLVGGLLSGRWLAAQWYANQGAVLLARAELADWPAEQWADGRSLAALTPAQARLAQAAALDETNVTAQYRLGLLAMLARDFDTAVTHLKIAYQQQPAHHGIAKSLGYSYVWINDLDQASIILAPITEAEREMTVYAWWWQEQNEVGLSQKAAEMAALLGGA